jgi:hypothetical protein
MLTHRLHSLGGVGHGEAAMVLDAEEVGEGGGADIGDGGHGEAAMVPDAEEVGHGAEEGDGREVE